MKKFISLGLLFICFCSPSYSFDKQSSSNGCDVSILSSSASAFISSSDDSLYYNQVVRMKDGRVLVGRVQYDEETDRYTIKSKEGTIQTVLHRDIDIIEEYSRTYLPPQYNPTAPIYPCDERQRDKEWYFIEARAWGMITGKDASRDKIGLNQFTVGGELIPGLRFAKVWGVGLGIGYFSHNDISRIPLFIHGRYQLSLKCFAPFIYGQLGTVFDNQSGDRIAWNKIFHPGPKIAGVGIGFDYPLLSWMDISADIGYRYLQLPTKVPCDCGSNDPALTAVYYNESHGLLIRVGITF